MSRKPPTASYRPILQLPPRSCFPSSLSGGWLARRSQPLSKLWARSTLRVRALTSIPLTPRASRGGFSPRGRKQARSEEHTSELQSRPHLVCRLLLEKKKKQTQTTHCMIRHVDYYLNTETSERARIKIS